MKLAPNEIFKYVLYSSFHYEQLYYLNGSQEKQKLSSYIVVVLYSNVISMVYIVCIYYLSHCIEIYIHYI